jgi:cytochrome-b5 reductase
MSKNSQSLNHNTNTKEIILGIAVASLVGVITWKMFLKKFFGGSKEEGPKYASTLIDRDTKVSLKLIKKTEVSHDTRLFRFELPSPQHVLGLPVGKHISLVADIDGKKVIRSYTPVSSDKNDQGYVDLIIKVYFPNVHPKFPEGGKMTMYLENMKIGDSIDFVGPKGFIEYQSTGSLWIQQDKKVTSKAERVYVRKIGMIAGGSGITPMLQIMRHIASNQPEDNTEVSLLFANQTEKDILCREEIEDLVAKSNGKFKVHYTLDKAPENWKYSTGFINQEMLEMTMPAYGIPTPGATPQILICGPPPMIKFACMPALEKMGWESEHIYTY